VGRLVVGLLETGSSIDHEKGRSKYLVNTVELLKARHDDEGS